MLQMNVVYQNEDLFVLLSTYDINPYTFSGIRCKLRKRMDLDYSDSYIRIHCYGYDRNYFLPSENLISN
jgi:hypothetical protein